MLQVFAVALFAGMPQGGVACDYVDLVEVNHVHDQRGKRMYSQALFYDWLPRRGEYQVRAWRLLKDEADRPERDFQRGDWVMIFTEGSRLREVRAAVYRESWTQYDREQAERDRLPKDYRPGLLFERSDP